MILFRASAIGKIMTEPKSKSEILSVGAKTELRAMAKEMVYGYDREFSSKYTEKGLRVEDESIELYNTVNFTEFTKNKERRSNEWVTGECDIYSPAKIVDIKSSWSLDTFPTTAEEAEDKGYEWQGRVYMWLWDVPSFEVAHCLVTTPDDLIGYERPEIHIVDHINPALRVTVCRYERDPAIEQRMAEKVDAARAYIEAYVKQIAQEHA